MLGPTGARLGQMAGNLFREVTGVGDYKVSSNSLMSSIDQLPSFKNMSAGTRVQHREFLFDVITSDVAGQFKIQTVPIQPALTTAFPWLAASAENYQEYKLNGVVYEFKSNSYNALASTNTASGTVVMATDYNVLDPPFTNKFQMEQTQFTCSGKPSINLLHPIECNKLETPTSVLFTRAGPVTTGDLRLYDWGNFQIATVGMQGTSVNIGELWVTYDLTLLKPKLNSTVDVYDHYVLDPAIVRAGGLTYFGTTTAPPSLTSDSDMGTTLSAVDSVNLDTINFPSGYTGKVALIYRIGVESKASADLGPPYFTIFSGGVSPLYAFSGVSPNSEYNGGTTNPLLYNGNGGSTYVIFLNVSNGGSVQIIGGNTGPLLPVLGDLFLIALPENFLTSDATLPLSSSLSSSSSSSSSTTSTSSSLSSKLELKRYDSQTSQRFDDLVEITPTSYSHLSSLSKIPSTSAPPSVRSSSRK